MVVFLCRTAESKSVQTYRLLFVFCEMLLHTEIRNRNTDFETNGKQRNPYDNEERPTTNDRNSGTLDRLGYVLSLRPPSPFLPFRYPCSHKFALAVWDGRWRIGRSVTGRVQVGPGSLIFFRVHGFPVVCSSFFDRVWG